MLWTRLPSRFGNALKVANGHSHFGSLFFGPSDHGDRQPRSRAREGAREEEGHVFFGRHISSIIDNQLMYQMVITRLDYAL